MRSVGIRVAAAAMLPLLFAATACGSDDDKAASGKVLTLEQLKGALVTDKELPGWTVTVGDPDDEASDNTDKADKPECQPLLDLVSSDKEHTPTISTTAVVTNADESVTHLVAIGQFDGDKAETLLTAAKAALPKCAAFKGTEADGTETAYTFKAGKALSFGDDALTVEYTADGDSSTPIYTTRSGAVILMAGPLDFSTEANTPAATTPEELIRAQYDKLVAAQKG